MSKIGSTVSMEMHLAAKAHWPTKPSGYRLDLVIGMGSFGIVWKATCIEGVHSEQKVAIKVVSMSFFEDSSMQEIRKECAIMSTSKHPNIVAEYASFISHN